MLTKTLYIGVMSMLLFSCNSGTHETYNTDTLIEDGVEVESMDSPSHAMPVVPLDTQQTDMPIIDIGRDSIDPK